jgi:hypothetical protein
MRILIINDDFVKSSNQGRSMLQADIVIKFIDNNTYHVMKNRYSGGDALVGKVNELLDCKNPIEKIYEIREFTDGGPNDRGVVIGYIKSSTPPIAQNAFVQYFEISHLEYISRLTDAYKQIELFKL